MGGTLGIRRGRQPGADAGGLQIRTASRRPSIPGCPAAAATRCAGCTTSRRRSSARARNWCGGRRTTATDSRGRRISSRSASPPGSALACDYGASVDTGRSVDDKCFVVDSPQAACSYCRCRRRRSRLRRRSRRTRATGYPTGSSSAASSRIWRGFPTSRTTPRPTPRSRRRWDGTWRPAAARPCARLRRRCRSSRRRPRSNPGAPCSISA